MRLFDSPLARWAFPAVGAVALATGQYVPALICAAIAAYAWRIRRR